MTVRLLITVSDNTIIDNLIMPIVAKKDLKKNI